MNAFLILYRKDQRLCRNILISTVTALGGISALSILLTGSSFAQLSSVDYWALVLGSFSHFVTLLSYLLVPIVAGHVFASERATRTIEFIGAALPTSRSLICTSKYAVWLTYWFALTWTAVSASLLADLLIGDLRSASNGTPFREFSATAYPSAFLMGAVAWSVSALIDSVGISIVSGFCGLFFLQIVDQLLSGALSSSIWIWLASCVGLGLICTVVSSYLFCSRENL